MDVYEPAEDQNPDVWLGLDEETRILLAIAAHSGIDDELLNQRINLHASLHVLVENQLAFNTEHIPETLARLIERGMGRHDAIHAISAVILEEYEMEGGFSSEQYRLKFEAL